MRLLVLGAAGAMAREIVHDLLQFSSTEITAADIDYGNVRSFVGGLKSERVEAVKANAMDQDGLARICAKHDAIINSTWYHLNLHVMRAAIKAGIHYIDLGGLYHMTKKQLELDGLARDSGTIALLGMGSSPGTMNVMAVHGAREFDKIERVKLRSGSKTVWAGSKGFQVPYSIRTVIDEFSLKPAVLRSGRMGLEEPLTGKESYDFPSVGHMEGYYTLHSEMATLPRSIGKGVKEMDFIVAYPKEFTETLAALTKIGFGSKRPIRVGNSLVKPYDVLTALAGPRKERPDLDTDVQAVELVGTTNGRKKVLRYHAITNADRKRWVPGGTIDTAVPPSIAVQLLPDKLGEPGVAPPEARINPLPFFKELGRRKIKIYRQDLANPGEKPENLS